jgi:hypothetical protein
VFKINFNFFNPFRFQNKASYIFESFLVMEQSYINRSEAAVVQFSYEKYKSSRRVRFGLFWAFINLVLGAFAISEM